MFTYLIAFESTVIFSYFCGKEYLFASLVLQIQIELHYVTHPELNMKDLINIAVASSLT